MSCLLGKPAAELVGAGMQAVGVAIPVGPVSAKLIDGMRNCGLPVPPKSWFKRKDDKARTASPEPTSPATPAKSIYDKLEYHINGLIQVAKPTVELKRIVREGCCRSAERPASRDQRPKEEIRYYTPQKSSSGSNVFLQTPKSDSPKKKLKGRVSPADYQKNRVGDGLTDEVCIVCLSGSRSFIQVLCGARICVICDEIEPHEDNCKQCQKLLCFN